MTGKSDFGANETEFDDLRQLCLGCSTAHPDAKVGELQISDFLSIFMEELMHGFALICITRAAMSSGRQLRSTASPYLLLLLPFCLRRSLDLQRVHGE
jgi:hypothetical protein